MLYGEVFVILFIKMSKKNTSVEKEITQAVVIADTFNKNFSPASFDTCFLPVVNKKLLNYVLEWLSFSGINEVILFCARCAQKVKQLVENEEWGIKVKVFVSEGCYSLGDIMRTLDSFAIIRNNFVLLSCDVIGNINFTPVLNCFKEIQTRDKGASMMMVYKEIGKDRTGDSVIGFDSNNKILYHQLGNKKAELPVEILLGNDVVNLRADILNTYVAVCSVAVPALFSDNFDFQNQNDLIREILANADVLANTLYCYFLQGTEYIAKIGNWVEYQSVSRNIIQRWIYPMVPDVLGRYAFRRNCIYIGNNVTIDKGSKINPNVVIGTETRLNENIFVTNSTVGENCCIGSYSIITNSFIFDNVSIGKNCIISDSVISESCSLQDDCIIEKGSILGPKIVLQSNSKVSNLNLVSAVDIKNSDRLIRFNENSFVYKSITRGSESEDDAVSDIVEFPFDKTLCLSDEFDSDESSVSDQSSGTQSPVLDDIQIFYNEVFDSLNNGYEDKLKCENMILEINSSRYAYNITTNEVNYNVIKAILSIQHKTNLVTSSPAIFLQQVLTKLNYFMPMVKNYIKNEEAQHDCLEAFADIADSDVTLISVLPKVLHYLYEKDVLTEDAISKWYHILSNERVKEAVCPFVNWLNEAEEESDESD